MVAIGPGEEPHAVVDRAAFGIGRRIVEPADAGKRDRARAHGARLERDMQVAIGEPFAGERERGGPDRHDLAMRGRVAVGQRAVAGLRDHRAVAHDDAADRHLAGRRGGAGLRQRQVHEGRWGYGLHCVTGETVMQESCAGPPRLYTPGHQWTEIPLDRYTTGPRPWT